VVPLTRAALDVTDAARVLARWRGARPDWVCHLAAYTDVDGCESKLDHAMR
jgi:dTDP-4-dehydrorhamnose reductase